MALYSPHTHLIEGQYDSLIDDRSADRDEFCPLWRSIGEGLHWEGVVIESLGVVQVSAVHQRRCC